ncbi:nucleotidyltransferase domain-containing protein [Streptomyces canus]|uniref:nucleotidyltransferase domain-containing protein n=1 Tax=Streptomyces canus TaxID=58343 RepID=UPI0037188A45
MESLDWRPIRFVLTAPNGREIDLHPLVFSDDGSAVQTSPDPQHPFVYPSACFVTGTIQGTPAPCLSAEQQVYFHQGYRCIVLGLARVRRYRRPGRRGGDGCVRHGRGSGREADCPGRSVRIAAASRTECTTAIAAG